MKNTTFNLYVRFALLAIFIGCCWVSMTVFNECRETHSLLYCLVR